MFLIVLLINLCVWILSSSQLKFIDREVCSFILETGNGYQKEIHLKAGSTINKSCRLHVGYLY